MGGDAAVQDRYRAGIARRADESPNALLHELGKHGLVYHFVAEVPTANDLFVQSIQQNPTLNS